MEELDLSQFPTSKIETAFQRALDNGDMPSALMFKAELDKRSKTSTPSQIGGDTGIVEQGLSGLYEGLASGAGAPVDIIGAGLRKIGVNVPEDAFGGSESIKRGLGLLSGGQAISDVAPQTQAQRIVRGAGEAIGEALPAAATIATAGPKAVASAAPTLYNTGKRLLAGAREEAATAPAAYYGTEAVMSGAGGAAGSTVEQAFPENPTAKMVAEFLGATAGGAVSNVGNRLLQAKPSGPLTAQELKQVAGDIYDSVKTSDVIVEPQQTANIFTNAAKFLDDEGLIDVTRGKVTVDDDFPKLKSVYEDIKAYAGKPLEAKRALAIRKSIARRLNDTTTQPSERMLLRRVLTQFDEQIGDLAPEIKSANAIYSRAMKADHLDDMMEIARLDASRYSQSGVENAIRQQFRNLAKSIVRGKELGWTQDEVSQINQIAEGGTMENIARFIGKFSPEGVVSAGVALGGPFSAAYKITGEPITSAAVAGMVGATGKAGKMTAAALQKQNVDKLLQSIVQGRNVSKPVENRLRAALTAYLMSQGVSAGSELAAPQEQ
jgi:hypothetical protein